MSEPLTHAQAEALLPGYQDGSLSREQVRGLHAHFKDCEACRSRIRLRRAMATGRQAGKESSGLPPEVQAQMARNRDLMIKILALMVFALLVWRFRR